MVDTYYTYQLCSSEDPNTPFYIGFSGNKNRLTGHKWSALHGKCHNIHLQNKILKVLRDGFDVIATKIASDCSKELAIHMEIFFIKYLKESGIKLCNKSSGGENPTVSEETKEKHRISTTKQMSVPENRDNLSKLMKGNKHMSGKKQSDFQKQQIRKARLGSKWSEETRSRYNESIRKRKCLL